MADQLAGCGSTATPARRAVLLGAVALGALTATSALAQRPRRLLGVQIPDALPDALQAFIPDAPMDALRTVEAVIALEREADVRRLPQSILSRVSNGLPISEDTLYLLALPRLVALVDRAERRDIPFADRAGALLAQLHAGQHEVAAAWLSPPVTVNTDIGRADTPHPAMLGFQEAAPPAIPPTIPPISLPPPLPEVPQVSEPIIQTLPATPAPVELPAVPAPPAADDDVSATGPATGPATAPEPMRHSTRFAELDDEYSALFATATLRDERSDTARWYLAQLRAARPRYQSAGARTGVPWYFIGAIHGLEASFNFRAHLHNGDFPLSARTRQVPAGHPTRWLPPSDWESSAIDALRLMGFAGQADWSLARTLYRLEAFNGFGYRGRGVPTPYLWSFSNHYDRGKFVADGRWSASARSQQCGAAVLLKLLADAGELRVD